MESYDFPKVTELAIPFFVTAILIELCLIRTARAPREPLKPATR